MSKDISLVLNSFYALLHTISYNSTVPRLEEHVSYIQNTSKITACLCKTGLGTRPSWKNSCLTNYNVQALKVTDFDLLVF